MINKYIIPREEFLEFMDKVNYPAQRSALAESDRRLAGTKGGVCSSEYSVRVN